MTDAKEIKRHIRRLKKYKKDTRVGTEARRQINKQIRELKDKLERKKTCDSPEKQDLIDKINAVRLHVNDLQKFSIAELQFHYDKITKG